MKTAIRGGLMLGLILGAVLGALSDHAEAAPARTKSRYTKEECIRCHPAQVNDIATAGGKHRNVPCMGCHYGHPPEVKKPIPQCSKCHLQTRKAHFEITGCLNCHKNPHTPLRISFKGKDACLNCHEPQVEQLRDNPSRHSALDCAACHDVHRKVPLCTQCHIPHSGKVAGACTACHNPHMPKLMTFPADIPSRDCGTCHRKPAALLSVNASGHRRLECARCHHSRHTMIPACQDCHGRPHAAGILMKFSTCVECHNIAHDLNNWPVTEAGKPSEEPPEK